MLWLYFFGCSKISIFVSCQVTAAWWQATRVSPCLRSWDGCHQTMAWGFSPALPCKDVKKRLPEEQPGSSVQQQTKRCHFGELCFAAATRADGTPEGRQISLNCLRFPRTPTFQREKNWSSFPCPLSNCVCAPWLPARLSDVTTGWVIKTDAAGTFSSGDLILTAFATSLSWQWQGKTWWVQQWDLCLGSMQRNALSAALEYKDGLKSDITRVLTLKLCSLVTFLHFAQCCWKLSVEIQPHWVHSSSAPPCDKAAPCLSQPLLPSCTEKLIAACSQEHSQLSKLGIYIFLK